MKHKIICLLINVSIYAMDCDIITHKETSNSLTSIEQLKNSIKNHNLEDLKKLIEQKSYNFSKDELADLNATLLEQNQTVYEEITKQIALKKSFKNYLVPVSLLGLSSISTGIFVWLVGTEPAQQDQHAQISWGGAPPSIGNACGLLGSFAMTGLSAVWTFYKKIDNNDILKDLKEKHNSLEKEIQDRKQIESLIIDSIIK